MRFALIIAILLLVSFAGGARANDSGGTSAQGQTPARPPDQRLVVGFAERARLYPGDFLIYAKIDTGARTSSLNAQDILMFERNGRLWVKFHVTNRENQTVTFERPVVRHVHIKDLTGPAISRPVVMLGLCVGDVFRVTEVNLSDRAGFNFQLLVGRRFMRQALRVDPARQFTVKPRCNVTDAALRGLDTFPGLPYNAKTE